MLLVVENVALGIDIRVRKQVVDLMSEGYAVSVVTRADPENAAYRDLPGLTVLEYPAPVEPSGPAGYLREYAVSLAHAAVLSARAHARRRVDVLQLCQPPDVYFPLARAFRLLGARVLVDQRDLMPELFAARYAHGAPRAVPAVVQALHWLERRTVRAADRAVTVNATLADRLVAAGMPRAAVSTVYNGPVLARVRRCPPDPGWRAGRAHLCCWIGKMGRQDRVDLLVDVVADLVQRLGRTDCRFVLLGDGECLEELRARVRERGVGAWVAFPGWVAEEEVFTCLATADVGVDTSLQAEVSPVKVLEYLAAGLPVAAFDLPETRAIAQGAAALVPAADVAALAEALDALLADPDRRAALGARGRARIEEELSWERQRETYLAAVAATLAGTGVRRAPGRRRRRSLGAGGGTRTRMPEGTGT